MDALRTLQNLFTLAFVVTSMLSMGLSLTVSQIFQPLRNTMLVIRALAANFLVVPAIAFALSRLVPLNLSTQIGLLLLGAAAGAPFLPKLALIAKADAAFAVGLMSLLMIVTIGYLPLVLPLLVPGVSINPGQIAVSLIVTMLTPLIVGLFVKARWAGVAAALQPTLAQISSVSLVLLLVLMLGLNVTSVLALFGTGDILATLVFIAISLGVGYVLGGPGTDTRRVLALGTGQRNMAATFIIATANFADQPDVLAYLAAAGLVGMIATFPTAAEFGRRARPTAIAADLPTES